MSVRTRYAPSPTGFAHLGFISRILINYALAKKYNGQFIWRNEDTDQKRFVPGSLEFNMKWVREFGFDWDEGPDKGGPYAPYTQSERIDLYQKAYGILIENGYAYRCFCTEERLAELRNIQQSNGEQTRYDGKCRNLNDEEIKQKLDNGESFTVRIKMPKNRIIEFDDLITHNHITWNSNDVDDYIIVKSNGIPTYHLAAMYDDIAMKITHVFRGSEWISTTPVHMMIFEGLGILPDQRPKIGHFTVILDPNTPGKKFSKRNSSFRVNGLVQQGYLKESILNYLMLLGWAPKDNRELFTLEEFIQVFDLDGMQKANPTWNQQKMDWFNGVYLRALSIDNYVQRFFEWIEKYLLTATKDELDNNFLNKYSEGEIEVYTNFAKELLSHESDTDFVKTLSTELNLVKERAVSFFEALTQIHFFYSAPQKINWDIKQVQDFRDKLSEIKERIVKVMESMDDDSSKWVQEDWVNAMRVISNDLGLKGGDSFMVLRIAVVGGPFSPPLFECLQILGRDEVVRRMRGS